MSRAIPSTMKQSPLEDIVYRRDSELRKRAVLSLTFHFRAWTVLNCRNSSRSNTATPVWGFGSAERLLRPAVAGSGYGQLSSRSTFSFHCWLSPQMPDAWTPGATADPPGNLALRIELFVSGRVSLVRLCR
jgi:hypothetical protein